MVEPGRCVRYLMSGTSVVYPAVPSRSSVGLRGRYPAGEDSEQWPAPELDSINTVSDATWFSNIYRIRAAAGIGSACGPGASPTPDLRGSARDAPRTRKYRRAARTPRLQRSGNCVSLCCLAATLPQQHVAINQTTYLLIPTHIGSKASRGDAKKADHPSQLQPHALAARGRRQSR
jgi:hypothetical protein